MLATGRAALSLRPVLFSWTHDTIHACGDASLCALRLAHILANAMMWKGLTQGLTPCATDGALSYPSCPVRTHAQTNKQTKTHTHTRNTRFLNIFTFFLGGMMIKAVHWGYPTVVTTTSNYRSPGSGKWHMDKCAMRLASPPEQVDGSEDAFKNIFNFVLFCFVFSNKQNVP